MNDKMLREYLGQALTWREAHVEWKKALSGVPTKQQGMRPPGGEHSPWELLEHMRIATWDMLEFSRDAKKHKSPDWPAGYWPPTPAPPKPDAWNHSVRSLERDLEAMAKLVADPKTDLLAPIPGASGQTILREVLLIADHNSYHLGQLVLVRRLLGCWPET